jgi:hypothetical protein
MAQEPFSILAVCTGNVCRSPAVERLLANQLGPTVSVSSPLAAAERGRERTAPDEDDVIDPFRRDATVYAESFTQIASAITGFLRRCAKARMGRLTSAAWSLQTVAVDEWSFGSSGRARSLTALERAVAGPRDLEPTTQVSQGIKSGSGCRYVRRLAVTDAAVIVTSVAIAQFAGFAPIRVNGSRKLTPWRLEHFDP